MVLGKLGSRTLTLQILLQALEADVAWCADDQDPQEGLYVTAEAFFLAKKKKNGFDERPQERDGDEQDPEKDDAALQVDRHGWTVASSEGLRSEGVEGRRPT